MSDAVHLPAASAPCWAAELLGNVEHLPQMDHDDWLSSLLVLERLPEAWIRRLVIRLGNEGGLPAVHDFVHRALRHPEVLVGEAQATAGQRLTQRHRERLGSAVRAHALGIVRTYGMRSQFHRLVHLFFRIGENDVALVADLLEALVGAPTAINKLYRKLASRDGELREYVLYVLAEFAADPAFEPYFERLARQYERETNEFVREAYEYLFDFERAP